MMSSNAIVFQIHHLRQYRGKSMEQVLPQRILSFILKHIEFASRIKHHVLLIPPPLVKA